jgi:hypothetical protein
MAAAAAQQPLQLLLQQLISRREFANSTAAFQKPAGTRSYGQIAVTAGKGETGSALVVIE